MRTLLLALFVFVVSSSYAQLVSKVELKDSVEGICNQEAVYALFEGFQGQAEPVCSLDRGQMEVLLNNNITFLTNNPAFKGEGMIGVFINCEGEAILWEVARSSKSPELDNEVLEFFKTFAIWEAGTLNDAPVDAQVTFTFSVKKGELILY